MKISVNWLRQLVDLSLDGAALAERLTMAGLEVEGRAPFGAFSGVVAVEVRGKRPHPNAAKLTLVDVFDGQATTQVVCGAPNVPEPGAIVLWARPGAVIASGVTLQPKEVRGIVSPGMLCAEDELGIGTSHDGILVLSAADGLAPGDDVAGKLGLPDEILEINVTPNRPDCLAHLGIAREVAALTGANLIPIPAPSYEAAAGDLGARVELVDAVGCPRYTALALDGVKIGPSPLWLRLRLQSLGVRAISNVVDATNLVLQELGQPLHAFDLDRLEAKTIVIRRAKPGEKLTTLDGQERTLTAEDVAICDPTRAVAVAGVMGGATSEVSPTTTRILLESANFDPTCVRRTAKRLGLHTEASHRFERGVDPALADVAARRCAQLFVELAGARVVGPLLDRYPRVIETQRLSLRAQRTRALLGIALDAETQGELLTALGLEVDRAGETLHVRVPTRRPDLTREIDLIEEIARLHGLDKIPPTVPRLRIAPGASGDQTAERARDALVGVGFDEVVTYAFVPPASLQALLQPAPLRIQNPLREEQSAMRTTLVPGLLHTLQRNVARGTSDVRIFEVGEIFLPCDRVLPDEHRHVAGLVAGQTEGWLKPGEPFDLFDLRGAVEELLAALGRQADWVAGDVPWLHPGVQARVLVDGKPVGVLGEVHPDVTRALGVEARPLVFELDLGALGGAPAARYHELPRHPAITRDLSFFVAADVPARQLAAIFDEIRDPLCTERRILEDYREAGRVPAGQKGMLWSFTYRAPDRTLTDAEVQPLHERLLARLKERLPITPR